MKVKKSKGNADKPKKKKKAVVPTQKGVEVLITKKKKKKKKPKSEVPKQPEETPAQKYQRELEEERAKKSREDRAYKQLTQMKRKDMVRECVLRGCPPEKVVAMTTPQLAGWFTEHLDDGQDTGNLILYDTWVESELKKAGVDEQDLKIMTHPLLRLGYAGRSSDWDKDAVNKSIKSPDSKIEPKVIKEKKEKRVKDEKNGGIFVGTKKHMTYELARAGKSIEYIIKKVTKQFPGANESSIKIWAKRALK